MIFPPISPAAFYLLATMLSCPAQPTPVLDVSFTNNAPVQINNLGSAQLGKVKVDTTVSKHRNEAFITGGLTNGSLKGEFHMTYQMLTAADKSAACIWMDTIGVSVTYTPTVYIAQEYPPGTCKYDTTWLHELKHVNTDVITINEYLPRIKNELQAAVNQLRVIGPVTPAQLEKKKQEMTEFLRIAMDQSMDRMNDMRQRRQQLIDTRQEYLRLSKVCPP